ncbi:MAG: hypothetical protein GY720_05570 [bacterium]|nr:hypothetical protein [bacterium]
MRFRLVSSIALFALVVAACTPGDPGSSSTAATTEAARPITTSSTTTTEQPTPTLPARRPVPLAELEVWAFPGPNHYEGDVLTFQVPIGGFGTYSLEEAAVSVDGQVLDVAASINGDPLLGDYLVFADVFDTTNRVGGHWVEVTATLAPFRELDITQRIVVTPAAGRPAQETGSSWMVEETDCCNITYQENTAAARDIEQLVQIIDESAREVEGHFGLGLSRVDFVLIDTLWGNGGYAGREVVVSYLDRDYSPGRGSTFRQTVLHELAHAATDQIEFSTPWPLIEGVAVQFTGGHFKSEPLGPRVKALDLRGELPELDELFDTFPDMQHETRYVAVGAFAEYLWQEFGSEALFDVFDSQLQVAGSAWLDAAANEALGIDLVALQTGFDVWVGSHAPGNQVEDLALTIRLQEARRAFQAAHDPYPNFFIYPSVTATGQDSLAMRDPLSPRLVAVEALIAYAQDLIIGGDLEAAAAVVAEVERVVDEKSVGTGISGEFLAVAEAVAAAGYELLAYEPGSNTALVTDNAPELQTVDIGIADGAWVVTATR